MLTSHPQEQISLLFLLGERHALNASFKSRLVKAGTVKSTDLSWTIEYILVNLSPFQTLLRLVSISPSRIEMSSPPEEGSKGLV